MSNKRQTGTGSSTSTSETDDKNTMMMSDKRTKRMISNRESARRSRIRKQKLMQDLTEEATILQASNKSIQDKIERTAGRYLKYSTENNVLRAQEMDLTERLRALNGLIQCGGLALAVDFPQFPDPLLKRRQLPCPSPPITAQTSGQFQF